MFATSESTSIQMFPWRPRTSIRPYSVVLPFDVSCAAFVGQCHQ